MFFFNDSASTEIYTLSLHDALPISNTIGTLNLLQSVVDHGVELEKFDTAGTSEEYGNVREPVRHHHDFDDDGDRKSTRLNSSHANLSYAVFCLKKKIETIIFIGLRA